MTRLVAGLKDADRWIGLGLTIVTTIVVATLSVGTAVGSLKSDIRNNRTRTEFQEQQLTELRELFKESVKEQKQQTVEMARLVVRLEMVAAAVEKRARLPLE